MQMIARRFINKEKSLFFRMFGIYTFQTAQTRLFEVSQQTVKVFSEYSAAPLSNTFYT